MCEDIAIVVFFGYLTSLLDLLCSVLVPAIDRIVDRVDIGCYYAGCAMDFRPDAMLTDKLFL